MLCCYRYVFDDQFAGGVTAERCSGGTWEEGIGGAPATFREPAADERDGYSGEGNGTLLASFAGASDLSVS